jgi:pimeloyl-ACP methyl ester carboxylesterase
LDLIAPDLPGFAGSDMIPALDSIEGFARAIIDFADALEIETFDLVGHSVGGFIAQQIALDYGPRIQKLVLYGTAAAGQVPDRFESQADSIRRIEANGIAATKERIVASWFVAGKENPFYELCIDAGRGVTDAAAITVLKANDRWDARRRLSELRIPTLVIAGDRDRNTSPKEAFAIWNSITGAQLFIAPYSGQVLHLEKPALFNRVVAEFLLDGT